MWLLPEPANPGKQSVQLVAPGYCVVPVLLRPGVHALHSGSSSAAPSPVAVSYLPALHGVGVVSPLLEQTNPLGHTMQVAFPVSVLYVVFSHFLQKKDSNEPATLW